MKTFCKKCNIRILGYKAPEVCDKCEGKQNKWEEEFEKEFVSNGIKKSYPTLDKGEWLNTTTSGEVKNFISKIEQEAYERGKEEMIGQDLFTPVYLKGILQGKKDGRLQTLEEVEREIKDISVDYEELVDFYGTGKNIKVEKSGKTFKIEVLQTINKMKYEKGSKIVV